MTPTDFQEQFPAFVATSPTTIQRWLDMSSGFFDEGTWLAFGQTFFDRGLGCWVAFHLVEEDTRTANPGGGDAATKKVGTDMIQYDIETLKRRSADIYQTNAYGREYANMRDLVGAGPVLV